MPAWAWAATIAALAVLLAADLAVSSRRRRPARLAEAALWTAATIVAAVAFGGVLALTVNGASAGQFYAGWLTEYSLSLDNLFVFALLLGGSALPRHLHGRVLLIGIVLALLLRGIVIGLGAAALNQFTWAGFVFGGFLLYTAYRLVRQQAGGPDRRARGPLRVIRRLLPVSARPDGGRLFTRAGGRWLATPVLVVMIAIGVTDVLFAMDSIPAVLGLTRSPFLVFAANAFALLGLRHLYFIVDALLSRLAHLSAGLAAVLTFIGLKIISEALRDSGVHRLGPVPVPAVSAAVSLAVVGGLIGVTVLASLATARRAARKAGRPGPAALPRWPCRTVPALPVLPPPRTATPALRRRPLPAPDQPGEGGNAEPG